MNRETMRTAYGKIRADEDFKKRTVSVLRKPCGKRSFIWRGAITAACVLLVIGAVFAFCLKPGVQNVKTVSGNGVVVPRLSLPKTGAADAVFCWVVYNGKIYAAGGTQLDSKVGEALKGRKLGTAKANIDDCIKTGKPEDCHSEFASNFAGKLYVVKGYDPGFRILSFLKYSDGTEKVILLENLNGITVYNGRDVFGKLRLQNRITAVRTLRAVGDKEVSYPVSMDKALTEAFVAACYKAAPLPADKTIEPEANISAQTRFLELCLNDGCTVELTLCDGGTVSYRAGGKDIVFKIDSSVFTKMWAALGAAR